MLTTAPPDASGQGSVPLGPGSCSGCRTPVPSAPRAQRCRGGVTRAAWRPSGRAMSRSPDAGLFLPRVTNRSSGRCARQRSRGDAKASAAVRAVPRHARSRRRLGDHVLPHCASRPCRDREGDALGILNASTTRSRPRQQSTSARRTLVWCSNPETSLYNHRALRGREPRPLTGRVIGVSPNRESIVQ
jgi:hypothetical protein